MDLLSHQEVRNQYGHYGLIDSEVNLDVMQVKLAEQRSLDCKLPNVSKWELVLAREMAARIS